MTTKGEKATPHPSGLCPACLRIEREAEAQADADATLVETETPAAFQWNDDPNDAGKPWRERLRNDFDREDVYAAFRAAIVSGLNATRGVTKACRCGRNVTLHLPDLAQNTRAARDILGELEGAQKETPDGQLVEARRKWRDNKHLVTDAELDLLVQDELGEPDDLHLSALAVASRIIDHATADEITEAREREKRIAKKQLADLEKTHKAARLEVPTYNRRKLESIIGGEADYPL